MNWVDSDKFWQLDWDGRDYVRNYLNAANKGKSDSYIGYDVIVDLILSVRDLNARLQELENK